MRIKYGLDLKLTLRIRNNTEDKRRQKMNDFIFENSTKVYFGKGCVNENLSNILSNYGQKVMLCYGGGSIKKNGIYEEIVTILKTLNKEVVEFNGISSNPTYRKVDSVKNL